MTFGVFLQENFIWLPSPIPDPGNITKLYQKKSQNRASRVIKYKNAPCEIDPRSYL
jgi:hypothetical protein